jgi:hypothetical protein
MLETRAITDVPAHFGKGSECPGEIVSLAGKRPATYYEILGLDRLASPNEIERAFLKKVRNLLSPYGDRREELPFRCRQELVSLYVARDVLRDQVSREDHDFRFLSLRRKSANHPRPRAKSQDEFNTGRARIVEALLFAELASAASVQLALELHDPSTFEPFAKFLIENDIVAERDLEAALLGKVLLKEGRLRKAALKRIFKAMKSFGVDFVDSLFVTIEITGEELLQLARPLGLKLTEETIVAKIERSRVNEP